MSSVLAAAVHVLGCFALRRSLCSQSRAASLRAMQVLLTHRPVPAAPAACFSALPVCERVGGPVFVPSGAVVTPEAAQLWSSAAVARMRMTPIGFASRPVLRLSPPTRSVAHFGLHRAGGATGCLSRYAPAPWGPVAPRGSPLCTVARFQLPLPLPPFLASACGSKPSRSSRERLRSGLRKPPHGLAVSSRCARLCVACWSCLGRLGRRADSPALRSRLRRRTSPTPP